MQNLIFKLFFPEQFLQHQAIQTLINTRRNTGGLIKRIDENRELLELLKEKSPDLLKECPWAIGWIASNDRFFNELNAIANARTNVTSTDYPRSWPE